VGDKGEIEQENEDVHFKKDDVVIDDTG